MILAAQLQSYLCPHSAPISTSTALTSAAIVPHKFGALVMLSLWNFNLTKSVQQQQQYQLLKDSSVSRNSICIVSIKFSLVMRLILFGIPVILIEFKLFNMIGFFPRFFVVGFIVEK